MVSINQSISIYRDGSAIVLQMINKLLIRQYKYVAVRNKNGEKAIGNFIETDIENICRLLYCT